MGIPYYLIGVNAIALELLKDGIKPSRETKDIDFAIMISNIKQFEDIAKALGESGFNKVSDPWTFILIN
jgi:predicted nucleotidyltransferase